MISHAPQLVYTFVAGMIPPGFNWLKIPKIYKQWWHADTWKGMYVLSSKTRHLAPITITSSCEVYLKLHLIARQGTWFSTTRRASVIHCCLLGSKTHGSSSIKHEPLWRCHRKPGISNLFPNHKLLTSLFFSLYYRYLPSNDSQE